ncbi:hypothetical protein HMPREF9623_01670 [Stomatobaculum longum]|uniref:DUF1653 domain-containing protein n=1 Tax=Stomatobaculum longum TaxID=796942 RepID=A0AA36Y3F5_9FIRM|nr:hypothetical protein [Stomatobaculum longum]EHO15759.1 hypothetical protein HMPREF9623_01670 [Stomatobaculum longum]
MNKKESPLPGAFYRQEEGSLYQVRCVADDAAGGEALVICQKLSADFGLLAYRLSQFATRFSEVTLPEEKEAAAPEATACTGDTPGGISEEQKQSAEQEQESEAKTETRHSIPEPAPEERDRRFLHFLELQSPRERRIYLEEERDNLTERDILRIATTLEIEDSGEPEDQLRNAFAALRVQERYEKERGDRHV